MFAYGQTGCGKTHTMMGPSHAKGPEHVAEEDRGIIPKVIRHIFGFIDGDDKERKFLVRCSYLEIYQEKVLDLLNISKEQNGLQIKEDPQKGTYVKDLTTVIVKNVAETERALFAGIKGRKVGETAMNSDSSRSHSMFTLYIETSMMDPISNKQKIKAGKLNLVDLAGSERQSKTNAIGVRLDEAKAINCSLSVSTFL
jgi:kinesin family protein 3/17